MLTYVFSVASINNYPGGAALAKVNEMYAQTQDGEYSHAWFSSLMHSDMIDSARLYLKPGCADGCLALSPDTRATLPSGPWYLASKRIQLGLQQNREPLAVRDHR